MLRLFVFIFFSPAVIFIIYDIVFYYIPIVYQNYPYITIEYIFFMIFSDLFALIIFIYLYIYLVSKYNKSHREQKQKNHTFISIKYYYICIFLIFSLINYLIYSVFGNINYDEVINNYARFYAMSKRGTAWVFLIINSILFIMIIDLYKNGFNKLRVILFIISLTMLSLTGGRSLIIVLLTFVFFIFVVIHKYKIKVATIFIIIIFSLTVFIGNAILRASDIKTYLSKSSTFDFDNAFILNDTIQYTDNNSNYLNFIEDIFYMVIPRKLYPEKPMSTAETRLVYPDVAYRGTNYTFGLYANSLINTGYLFVFIVPIYLLIMNYLYIKYILIEKSRNLKSFLIVFFLFYSIQFVRGGLFNTRLLQIAISIILAYFIYTLIVKVKIK